MDAMGVKRLHVVLCDVVCSDDPTVSACFVQQISIGADDSVVAAMRPGDVIVDVKPAHDEHGAVNYYDTWLPSMKTICDLIGQLPADPLVFVLKRRPPVRYSEGGFWNSVSLVLIHNGFAV